MKKFKIEAYDYKYDPVDIFTIEGFIMAKYVHIKDPFDYGKFKDYIFGVGWQGLDHHIPPGAGIWKLTDDGWKLLKISNLKEFMIDNKNFMEDTNYESQD